MTGQSKQTDYSNGKVYVIISPNCDLFYYGSTVYTLKHRFSLHKTQRSCTSRKIIDAGDAEIYEIETYPCSCLEELEDREAFYIVNDWDGCVNELIPGAARRAGGRKAYKKDWEQKNKDKVKKSREGRKEKLNKYYTTKIECENCGKFVSVRNKAQHKKSKTCINFQKEK